MTQEILGRYELTSLLGRGGMGEVWAARDRQLGRRVAVKFLVPRGHGGSALTTLEQRFLREARFTAGLRHHGVPVVHDTGKLDDDRLYLVMELVPGQTLAAHLKDWGRAPVAVAASVAAQTADVLAYAHTKGVVHRDLKPSNLMLTPESTVKVLDFGIAAVLEPGPDEPRLTRTNAIPGTAGFMAPEQAEGKPVASSDLYSLGCVLYELLAGVPPLTAENNLMLLYRHMSEEPPALSSYRPDLPEEFAELVMRLLAKDPAHRPESAGAVRDAALVWTESPDHDVPGPRQPAAAATRRAELPGSSAERPGRAGAQARPEAAPTDPAAAAALLEAQLRESGQRLDDAESVPARLRLYDLLRQADEPGRAYEGFVALGEALRPSRPESDREVLACEAGAARCLAALGRTTEAVRAFEALLPLQQQAFGSADRAVFDTRFELAVLAAQIGDRRGAREVLARLREDQRAVLPESDGRHARTDELIARLDRLTPPADHFR